MAITYIKYQKSDFSTLPSPVTTVWHSSKRCFSTQQRQHQQIIKNANNAVRHVYNLSNYCAVV